LLAASAGEYRFKNDSTMTVAYGLIPHDMRVQLHRSTEAAQRAIIAESDERAAEFAREATAATAALAADRVAIETLVTEIGSDPERRSVQEFGEAFDRLQSLEASVLALAVENSNAKAQRLSFGPAREAADALRDAIERAARAAPPAVQPRAELLATRLELAVREIQALQAPHIAEPEDAAMTALEERMGVSEATARSSLAELSQLLGSSPGARDLAAAGEQLERFAQIHREIVVLSRANTEVRSLAVALGDMRALVATCDSALIALQESLAERGSRATR
jgi:hypothetical protein